jgi:hypothetical protein
LLTPFSKPPLSNVFILYVSPPSIRTITAKIEGEEKLLSLFEVKTIKSVKILNLACNVFKKKYGIVGFHENRLSNYHLY